MSKHDAVSFTVIGKPATSGSKRAFVFKDKAGKHRASLTQDNPRQKPFMAAVAAEAAHAASGFMFPPDTPLKLNVTIYRPRSASHYRTGRNSHLTRESAPTHPIAKPDSLKIVRAVEDALSGVLYHDDSRICEHVITKVFGIPERIAVTVSAIDQTIS